jgi:predicted anti-sigma-YlaC factor YlaD
MNELNCEDVLIAKMADADGEVTNLSRTQIELHIADCESCRHELEQMQAAAELLRRQSRSVIDADLWPAIEQRIGITSPTHSGWKIFALLSALLVAYKLLEMLPEQDPGFAFKLAPLLIVVVLFVFIKENPFRINTELILEKQ